MTAVATRQLEAPTNGEAPKQRIVVSDHGQNQNLLDTGRYEHLWRVAQSFAASDMVPEQFRGKPANCMIVLQMAFRSNVDPFMMMQNCYVVHGRPGIEAKLAIAMLNASGLISGRINFKLSGDGKNRKCVAFVTDKLSGQVIDCECTFGMAEAEGWVSKNGSKWKTMPDLMLRYRAATFLIRLHYPEVLMGMSTKDEIEDVGPQARQRTSAKMDLDALMSPAPTAQITQADLDTAAEPASLARGDLTPDQINDLRHGAEACGLPALALQSTLKSMFGKSELEQLTQDEGRRLRQYIDTKLD